jgi:glycosyltransferase involved in cell wall biosynthesis
MKRIICTVTNDLNFDQRMNRICSTLAQAGYDVTLVGRTLSRSRPLAGSQPFHRVRLHTRFEKGKLFYLEYNLRLFFFLLARPFDIINAVDLDTLAPGYCAARLKQKPLVFDAHEYFSEVPEVVGRPLVRKAWEIIASVLIPKVDFAYTVNRSLADHFNRQHGVPFQVIRNVPFVKKLPEKIPELQQRPFIILYQGVLNEGRGLEVAILAMRELPGAQLWLAGEGDLSQQLRELTKSANLAEKVVFLGQVLPDELSLLTGKAHLGLNLLENRGASYFYSLANKAFDYIQAGTPSIQMDFPEYRQLQEQYDVFLLLDSLFLSPSMLAAHINDLRLSENRYLQLQSNCRTAARKLNWEQEKDVLLSIFRSAET